jgi:hypothetical protein
LRSLKRHVGSSNRINELVLAHLAEVDARGAYRKWACETLAAYCIYELRLSEDEAQRRCRRARVMRQFPVLFAMVADASIHLTGILLLAPYLTPDNHEGVLVRARYRSKREIERLAAELAPARDVPALVEPLGVKVGSRTTPGRGWAALTESTLGWVRHVEPGDGPARAPSAADDCDEAMFGDIGTETALATAPARSDTPEVVQPDTADSVALPQLHYRVQFTADQAYVALLEQARALLWHQLPNGDLAELQRMALQALVDNSRSGSSARNTPGQTEVASPETDVSAVGGQMRLAGALDELRSSPRQRPCPSACFMRRHDPGGDASFCRADQAGELTPFLSLPSVPPPRSGARGGRALVL